MIAVIVFLYGLVFGSFYNVCIYRIPGKESIVSPPSHCISCGRKIKGSDLIPVFSYIYLRGKCRYCNAKIGIWDMLSEVFTGIIFLAVYLRFGLSWLLPVNIVLLSLLYIISVIDYHHQIIPDGLVITGIAAGILFIAFGITVSWLDGLIGFVVGGGFFLAVAVLSEVVLKKEGMGGGDIKLMAMIGLLLGWKLTILALILSIYAGGIIGGALLLLKIKKRGEHIPFGPFIALGTAISIFYGKEIISWYFGNF